MQPTCRLQAVAKLCKRILISSCCSSLLQDVNIVPTCALFAVYNACNNCLFIPKEIIRAAAKDQDELKDLLEETSTKAITETCFDEALIEACHRGNFDATCMLLVVGAKKIKESICISVRNGHYRISTLLLICYATLKGDVSALEMLLDKSLERYEWMQQFVDESVPIGSVVESIR